MLFLSLFISLPTKAATGRMRIWRALKGLGCATLRDGVYLLPDSTEHAAALAEVAADVIGVAGSAEVYHLSARDPDQEAGLRALFDRAGDYAAIAEEARLLGQGLEAIDGLAATRKLQALHRRFVQVTGIDFFPGEAQRQTLSLLDELRAAVDRHCSPDEPTPRQADLPRLKRDDYRGRTWATRARPWVDRLASAWLIRRQIDPRADFVWLAAPADCQPGWLGFDFDGAAFSHVGNKVTFETLLASFGLDDDPALARLGALVHCLDVGGLPVADAPGVESLLAGLRAGEPDDDRLLERAGEVFDWLMQHYKEQFHD